ncbi:exosome complex exonuclease RRP44-like [Petromyzon marinus]|uniref:exosome complex exonuclease RRP44-like n=1 Tax=Petromyzon marinus TaxID=7757 RepID=UPI003F6F966D
MVLERGLSRVQYSDVIVHRLLAVCVGADPTYPALTDKQKQQQLCNNLNYRQKMAQYAQRSSVAFHTQLFFKSKGVVSEEGFVLFVRKNAVVVLIPKYGLEGTVFFDSKDLKLNVTFDEEGPTLCVEGIALNMFDRVCVRVSLDSSNLQHQRIRMHLVRPEIPGYNPAESTPWGSPSPRPKKPRQR